MKSTFITASLLILSNVFMTFAWYWHMKFEEIRLWKVILISWCLAGLEYCLAVPANRIGKVDAHLSVGQLKILQEGITLTVFTVFAVTYLHEPLKWQYVVGVSLVFAGALVIFCL